MKIYIDKKFHCHTTNPDGAFEEIGTDFFNGKCDAYIEGFCYEPREDGDAFYPWKNYSELDDIQREYEREKLSDAENALAIMWGGLVV